jgi:Reverse transcriptase (RNA-dependent DNA polymerase)
MLNHHMASLVNQEKGTSEPCSQVAMKLLDELKLIEYGMVEVLKIEKTERKKHLWFEANYELKTKMLEFFSKNYDVEKILNLTAEKLLSIEREEWNTILSKLKLQLLEKERQVLELNKLRERELERARRERDERRRCNMMKGDGKRVSERNHVCEKKDKILLETAEQENSGLRKKIYGDEKKRVRLSLGRLIEEYPDVCDSEEDLGKVEFCPVEKCYINTREGEKVAKRGTRIPQSLKGKTKDLIAKLERRGIVQKSESQWRNPIRAIEKPNGEVRLVSNLMALNDEKDTYAIPDMRRVVEATVGSNFITIIDLKDGYYQIPIAEEHRHKTAFEFENQVFEWCGMVMGFKNAPMIFQRIMNKILT